MAAMEPAHRQAERVAQEAEAARVRMQQQLDAMNGRHRPPSCTVRPI
jgi:hypothetical protein